MNGLELMISDKPYAVSFKDIPEHLQIKAKDLCAKFNMTLPSDEDGRRAILKELFVTYNERVFIQSGFGCDYGFNIHFHGLAVINYNVTMLDNSPINIGAGAFIAPGVVLTCTGHSIDPLQRSQGVLTSAPITLEEDVWLGANVTVIGGVTIGKGSVIGAGSLVNKDIPAGVVAAGNPCKVIRKIKEDDKLKLNKVSK